MGFTAIVLSLAAGLFVGILICFEVGRLIAIRHAKTHADADLSGTGSIGTAVFALLGLLFAFTFYGAAGRFDTRRELIVEEANAIGTAYLRTQLLPSDVQPKIQELFRKYVDSRLDFYKNLETRGASPEALAPSQELQDELWRQSVSASQSRGAHPDAGKLLLPGLNEMIGITTTRTMAFQMHPPTIIFALLFGLSFLAAILAGDSMAEAKARNWLYMVAFAAMMAVSVFVILDLEFPRLGLIRVNAFDQALIDVRARMN